MRTVLVVLLALSTARATPIIRRVGHQHQVHLPLPISKALAQYDPSFQLWNESDYPILLIQFYKFSAVAAPFAVIGDFNGDHLPDVALHGRTSKEEVVLVALSGKGGSYRVHRIMHGEKPSVPICPEKKDPECGLGILLHVVPRGTHFTGVFEGRPLTLKLDAVEVVYWEKAAVMYYWEGGKFHTYTTAD